MMVVALSTKRPPRGGESLQARLAMVDHKAHRYPDQPRVPHVSRRVLEERWWWIHPFTDSQRGGGGNAPDT